jgi:hypothetical protein
VDKLPGNFKNLGLISLLFPQTRVIHCQRHPLDSSLSAYFIEFGGHHPYAYDLENLGIFYKEYERLMQHWYDVLQIPILGVQYEEMVADQEAMSRKILEFCGLEWDPNCLRFYETQRVVNTASFDQVRQPIYTRSVARYKHYEQHLGPLKAALGME